jgi:hypothetical protein
MKCMFGCFLPAIVLLLALWPGTGKLSSLSMAPPNLAQTLANRIGTDWVKPPLDFIASNKLKGRFTPSVGLDTAADYLAAELSKWSVRPAGINGSYFQPTDVWQRRVAVEEQCWLALNERRFAFGTDYFSWPAEAQISAAPLIYGGAGWGEPGQSDVIDAHGRWVVLFKNGRINLNHKRMYAVQQGAIGVIVIYPDEAAWACDKQAVETADWKQQACEAPTALVARFPAHVATAFFQGESLSLSEIVHLQNQGGDARAFSFQSAKRLGAQSHTRCETNRPRNVLARLEGTHPQLKNEYVVLSAHYDHLNERCREEDSICNGADDNGSGTVALLAVARALAAAPVKPKRSILFLWHCGEERQFIGARYFVKAPLIPLDRLFALLNVDMIGRSQSAAPCVQNCNVELTGPRQVYLLGTPLLRTLAQNANRSYLGLCFKEMDCDDYSTRSDHDVYAKQDIPWLLFTSGESPDYHKPDDEVERIDWQKLVLVTQTILATAWKIADHNG